MDEMRRIGAGAVPTSGQVRRPQRISNERRLAERVSQIAKTERPAICGGNFGARPSLQPPSRPSRPPTATPATANRRPRRRPPPRQRRRNQVPRLLPQKCPKRLRYLASAVGLACSIVLRAWPRTKQAGALGDDRPRGADPSWARILTFVPAGGRRRSQKSARSWYVVCAFSVERRQRTSRIRHG